MVGGILADQMGLGKILTTLSAIVGSLHLAHLWAGSASSMSVPTTGATLVIAPSESIINQWMRDIKNHLAAQSLRVLKYHGSKRTQSCEHFTACDVVLSTYATVSAEFRAGAGRLHTVRWFRIVLDEAHTIRDPSTAQFRAISTLFTKLRWCLTGTPIQNSLQDLGSLVRFLRIPELDSNSKFRQHIINPEEKGQNIGFTNLRVLLSSACLRRTKQLLKLPEPERTSHGIKLSTEEMIEYSRIIGQANVAVETAVSEGRSADARRTVFTMILKLRLLHAWLLLSSMGKFTRRY
ncbi:SNF2 family N-terminal domain-containing protein [Aspergillus terricola var. indicus]